MQELQYHPLANKYPLLQGQEYEDFKAGVDRAGFIREPIVIYEGKILDGRNRHRAGVELGIPVPTREFDPDTEGDPELFVENANDDRRHELPEVRQKRRAERIARVVQLRREGTSTREIADKVGISESQVRKDIGSATAHQCAVEPKKGTVTGRDGKTRAAKPKKPIREREPGADDDWFDDRDSKKDAKRRETYKPRPPMHDAVGQIVPHTLRDVFGDPMLGEAIAELQNAQDAAERIIGRLKIKIQHFPFILAKDAYDHLHEAAHALQCARETLENGAPYAVCPLCHGEGCTSCRSCGYYPGWRFAELKKQEAF